MSDVTDSTSLADQSWHNPRSRWRKRVRHVVMALVVAGAIPAFAVLIFLSYMVYDAYFVPPLPGMRPPGMDRDDLIVMSSMSVFMAAPLVFVLICAARFRRIAQRVVDENGRICPWCRRPLVPSDAAPGEFRCEDCDAVHAIKEIEQYWVNWVLHMPEAARWHMRNHPRRDVWWRKFTAQMQAPAQIGKVQKGWVVFAISIFIAWFLFSWWSMSLYPTLMLAVPMGITMAATAAITFRMRKRTGSGAFCASCEYQLPPERDELKKCPECASDWTVPGAVYTGKRQFMRREIIALSLVMLFCIVSFAFVLGTVDIIGNQSRWQSNDRLIQRALTSHTFFLNDWDELFSRTLTDEQQLTFARGLLERRAKRETLDRQANDWFLRQMPAGSLPQPIVDEFKSGILLLNVDAPTQVRVGEEVPLRITNIVQFRNVPPFDRDLAIIFGGFIGDDIDTPIGRTDELLRDSRFGSRRYTHGSRTWDESRRIDRDYGPIGTFTAATPGTLELRARYWLMWLPRQLIGSPLEWHEDGTPVIPPQAEWVYEQQLETTIEVLPAESE